MKSLTLGAAPDNDLVIDAPGVAPLHARARLDVEGYLWIDETDPAHPVRICRNGHWLRVRRGTVCAGDEIRLADAPVDLPALSSALGDRARLRSARLTAARHRASTDSAPAPAARVARDPVTGEIREVTPSDKLNEAHKDKHP
mgnify:CR=1 FL=1